MSELPDIKSLWNYHDPAASEQRFRELIPRAQADPEYHVELLSQIARTYSLRGEFEKANAQLDQAEAFLTPGMHRACVRCLLERGRVCNSSGNRKDAVPFFESAFRIAGENHLDFLAVDAAHMIAIAHPDPAEQIRWNLQTLEYVKSSPDASIKPWIGTLYNNLGWTYHDQKDYATSLKYLEESRAFYDQSDNAKFKFIAQWAVAKLLRLNSRCDEAMEIQKRLEAEMTARNDLDGFVYEELGELYLAQNNSVAAVPYFRLAYPLLRIVDWFVQSQPARLDRIKTLAGM